MNYPLCKVTMWLMLVACTMAAGCGKRPQQNAFVGKWRAQLTEGNLRACPGVAGKDISVELKADGQFAFSNLPRLWTDNTVKYYSGSGKGWEIEKEKWGEWRLYLNSPEQASGSVKLPGQRYSAIDGDIYIKGYRNDVLWYIWSDPDDGDSIIEFTKVAGETKP